MYWQKVLEEVLQRKIRNRFLFTNFVNGSRNDEIKDDGIVYTRQPKKSYFLGKEFPGLHLSYREAECILHLLRGRSLKGIGKLLNLSPRTVEYYLKNVKKKLECRTKFELIDRILRSEFLKNVDFK
jgi:DNA-binding CsgD family transcriptional regulator